VLCEDTRGLGSDACREVTLDAGWEGVPIAVDCRFPDALIPNVDPLFHEKRNAFPFTVPANQDRAVWVDAFVPSGQTPGLYTSSAPCGFGVSSTCADCSDPEAR